jgi:hypothetical protein
MLPSSRHPRLLSVQFLSLQLVQNAPGTPIRKAGISEQTFYRWKAKYAGLEVEQVRQMAQLQEENLGLKQLVAELTLDKTMLQDVLPPQQAKTACRGPRLSKKW